MHRNQKHQTMSSQSTIFKSILFAITLSGIAFSCKKPDPSPSTGFRSKLDYGLLSDTIGYAKLFKDANGDSTVNRTEGRTLYHMFRGLNTYSSSSITSNTFIDSTNLKNLFNNTGSPFTGTYPGSSATILNTSGQSIAALTGYSRSISSAETIKNKIISDFGKLSKSSLKVTATASKGNAGKLFTTTSTGYLVDEKGIEYIQIIQKGLIGAFQLDYVCNYLLSDDRISTANNSALVPSTKYTELEHNWDIAYGVITIKDRYASSATLTSNGGEGLLGAYVWEYNKEGYPKIHPAFLKGRMAIVNNDIGEVKAQADIIRRIIEKAIASSAVGYLKKWKDGTTDAIRAHAIGEGLGFIYSIRFCKLNGGDDAFSDGILNDLINSPDGFWDLDNTKINAAIDKINAKFAL